jgi:hypothetical protein
MKRGVECGPKALREAVKKVFTKGEVIVISGTQRLNRVRMFTARGFEEMNLFTRPQPTCKLVIQKLKQDPDYFRSLFDAAIARLGEGFVFGPENQERRRNMARIEAEALLRYIIGYEGKDVTPVRQNYINEDIKDHLLTLTEIMEMPAEVQRDFRGRAQAVGYRLSPDKFVALVKAEEIWDKNEK